MFHFKTISFSSNSGGGVKYTTLFFFSCKKAGFISMELHVHQLDALLSSVKVRESFSISEESLL